MALATAAWDRRTDLIYEGAANLNASGQLEDLWMPDGVTSNPALTTPWHSSAGIASLRIVTNYGSLTNPLASFNLVEATFMGNTVGSPVILREQVIPVGGGGAYVSLLLTARMFSFQAGGDPGDSFALTVRAMT
jgi:hypothetical protein